MKTKNIRGAVAVAYLLYVAIAGAGLWAYHEYARAFGKDTHKPQLIAASAQANAASKAAQDALAKAQADRDAHQKAETDLQAQITAINVKLGDIAGMDYTAGLALQGEKNPSDAVSLASTLISDAGKYLPAVTVQQQKDAVVIVGLQHDKAALAAALAEKTKEADLHAAGEQKAQLEAKAALVRAAQADDASKVAEATNVANTASAAKQVSAYAATVSDSLTTIQRIKAAVGGTSIVLFVLIPLVVLAFPGTWPFFKALTKPVLGFFHMIHDRILSVEQAAHAATATKLAAEQAAHEVTKSVLATTQAQVMAIAAAAPAATSLSVQPKQ